MRDTSILKLVVLGIIILLILVVVGMILLIIQDKNIPGTLETLAVAGLTGLLGLLAPSREATRGG